MSASDERVPQPEPADSLPQPEPPPHLLPRDPSVLRLCQFKHEQSFRLAAVFKRTYRFEPGEGCRLADEQRPLEGDGQEYEPSRPDGPASWKALPEVIGNRSGTDVIVQGSARPQNPVTEMSVGVRVGDHRHVADVVGDRVCRIQNGRITFSTPKPFEEIKLRYENAYGGLDPRVQKDVIEEAEASIPEERLRRVRPLAQETVAKNNLLMYPRNRFGKGYVLGEDPENIEGRELPNIERPGDRLSPDRLVMTDVLDWLSQPVPIGFDFLDPLTFPRSAMIGLAPPSNHDLTKAPEVELGLVPTDYFRGRVWNEPAHRVPELVHPASTRCASLGLTLPFLQGDETVELRGMDARAPQLRFRLPGEVPIVTVPDPGGSVTEMRGTTVQVTIGVDERVVELIWVANRLIDSFLSEADLVALEEGTRARMVGASR